MEEILTAPDRQTTARLILRKPRLDDAEAIFLSYATDELVPRYTMWRVHDSVDDTRIYLETCLEEWSSGRGFPYVIECQDTPDHPVGMIHMRPDAHQMLFGYVIARNKWGKGLTSEALGCLVDWSLAQDEIWRAAAYCDVDNPASARVMEKAGMTFEGILRRYSIHPNVSDEPRDCRVYVKAR